MAKGTQNHPHVAFAGSALGDAKTGAFAGLRRKGMRRFDCGGSAKQALLSPAGRRCEQTGPVFTRSAFTPPFSLQAIMRRLKTADWRPRCGRDGKRRSAKALFINTLALLKSTRSRDRTGTAITGHRILSPACLPIPPSEQPPFVRKAGQKYELIFYSARKRTVLVRLDAGGSASDSGDGRGNRKPYHPL